MDNITVILLKIILLLLFFLPYHNLDKHHIYNLFIKKINSKPFELLLVVYYLTILLLFALIDFDILNDIFIPELVLFFFLSILLLLLIIYKKSVTNDSELRFLCEIAHTSCMYLFILYLFSLFCIFFINIKMHSFDLVLMNDYRVIFKFNFYYLFDTYTFISKCLIIIFFLINLFFSKYSYCFNFYKKLSVEYIPLLSLCVLISCLAVSSNDLFIIFILFEIISFLMIYLLIINSNFISIEASIKFFFLNSFVGALGFLGVLILYLINGFFSTNLDVLYSVFNVETYYYSNTNLPMENLFYFKIGCFLIFLNFFFKFGIFPVHIFIVDIYAALPMISIFFISTTLKLGYLFIFIKLLYYCFNSFLYLFSPIILVISIITYILGVCGAYNETNLKKFLAYSSISHAGFMLFSLGGYNINFNLSFMLFYFIIYIFSNIVLFAVILNYIDLKNNGELFNNFNDFYLLNYSISSKKFYFVKNTILHKFFITISM